MVTAKWQINQYGFQVTCHLQILTYEGVPKDVSWMSAAVRHFLPDFSHISEGKNYFAAKVIDAGGKKIENASRIYLGKNKLGYDS